MCLVRPGDCEFNPADGEAAPTFETPEAPTPDASPDAVTRKGGRSGLADSRATHRAIGWRYASGVDDRSTDARVAAWWAVHDALPARWHARPVTYDPGHQVWSVTAHGPLPGRGKAPQVATGTGEDEVAALRDLDLRLRGIPRLDGGRLEELNRRLRQAFVAGAEADSRRRLERGMTADELDGVLRRYPGDLTGLRSGVSPRF